MEYKKVYSEEEILILLKSFEGCFPHLRSHITNLADYSKKLASYAEVYSFWRGDTVMGIVVFYANDRKTYYGYISLIGLLPEYRRKGNGAALLRFCEEKMRQAGEKQLKLEVDDDNISAQGFYRHMGLKETGRASETSFYMEKDL